MHIRRTFFLAGILSLVSIPAFSATKIPLSYTAYDGWNGYAGTAISADGTWFAYGVQPQDGDGTLVVRNLASGTEVRAARGRRPVFSEDGRFVFFEIAPVAAELDAAQRAHKKADQLPKNGFGSIELSSGHVTTVDHVKSYAFARHGSRFVAYLLEHAPAEHAPGATSASSAPYASPAPSALPTPAENKKKDDTSVLVLRTLADGTTVEIPNVAGYAMSDDEHYLAYATETADGTGDGVHVRDLTSGAVRDVAMGAGRYEHLTFAREGDELAFESDRASYASGAPHFDVYVLAAADAQATVAIGATTPGMPSGWSPDADGAVAFSWDGKRLFIGANVAPAPLPMNTPEPMHVDLWNWHDMHLQSQQAVEADQDRKRTYLGVYDLAAAQYRQIGSPSLARVETNKNGAYALGIDDRAYERAASYDGGHADYYVVSLATGAKRLVARHQSEMCSLSPGGSYVLCFDGVARAWFTVRSSDGRKRYVTPQKPSVAFYDEQDDHPDLRPPYGSDGWTSGDRAVLLRDRYDIWAFDPDGAGGQRLTGGFGRTHRMRFATVQLGEPGDAFDPAAPLYLSALDDVTKASAFYRLAGVHPTNAPQRLIVADARLAGLQKAKHADRFVFTRERFDEFPDTWTARADLAGATKITNLNPQMAMYRWGHEHLVHYTTLEGKHLDGIVYLPDNFDMHRKYPMLVYFYERFSDDLHAYHAPRPSTGPDFVRFLSHGYVVLVPDIAYTTGHPGKNAYDALMPAIDTVVKRGYIDPKRIGISGHSWAAYQIAYVLTRTHRFAAAEAGAAVADMVSAYGGIRWGSGIVREVQYEHGQSRIGATPWDRPDLYLENSAIFHIRNVETPYLTIANDNDDAVPWYQGIEFFTALRRLNKEAYMFVFNGEYHNLRGREQQKYWTVHFNEFFDHFLLGTPEPQWMSGGVDYLHRGERDVRPLYGEKP